MKMWALAILVVAASAEFKFSFTRTPPDRIIDDFIDVNGVNVVNVN